MMIPVVRDTATAQFFDGTARGELLIRRCDACRAYAAPQCDACPSCHSASATLVPTAGMGSVVSWTVAHGRPREGAAEPERTAALIELTEGPWLYAALRGMGPGERPWPGMRVTLAFEHPEGGEAVPVFLPAAAAF